jgi:hypothetical protein
MDTLAWGLRNAIPDTATAAWGARFIIYADGGVDFVPNRTDVVGTTTRKAALLAMLNDKLPKRALIDIISAKIKAYEISTREPNEVVLFDDGELKVVGNSNGSHGYFYVVAFATTGKTSDEALTEHIAELDSEGKL